MAQWDRKSRERDSSRTRDTLVHVTNHESLDGCPQRACQQAGPGVCLEKRLRCMDSVVAASPPRPYICTTLVQVHQDGAAPEQGDEEDPARTQVLERPAERLERQVEGALAVAAGALEPALPRRPRHAPRFVALLPGRVDDRHAELLHAPPGSVVPGLGILPLLVLEPHGLERVEHHLLEVVRE